MKNKQISCLACICLITVVCQNNGYAQVSEDTLKGSPIAMPRSRMENVAQASPPADKRSAPHPVSEGLRPIKNFVKTVGGDILHVATSPVRMSKNDGLQLLAFTAITTGFVSRGDRPIDEEFGIEVDNSYLLPARGLARIGEVYDHISPKRFSTALSIAMLTGGLAFRDKKLLKTTRLMFESVFITQLITSWSKDLFGRSRPYTGKGPHDFKLFASNSAQEFRSMPSGHTSSAFAMMTVIAEQYDRWWVKIPAYTFAASVACQRMNSRQHWASDVIVGGGIGYWVGSALANRNPEQSKSSSISPYLFGNRIGLAMNF